VSSEAETLSRAPTVLGCARTSVSTSLDMSGI
jgi:hypothetical protein